MLATEMKVVQLQDWINSHTITCETPGWSQIKFVRDTVPSIVAKNGGIEQYTQLRECVAVISEHYSKSVLLPVYQFVLPDGVCFTLRNNFYDWKVSVESPDYDVAVDFMGLFDPTHQVSRFCCEGFPVQHIHGPYAKDKRHFTFELTGDNYQLFTFFWIFTRLVQST